MAGQMWISPEHRLSYLDTPSLDRKIEVFRAQLEGWTLAHARALMASGYEHRDRAGFAILMLCTAYFETLEGCHQGRPSKPRESSTFFAGGFRRVFGEVERKIRDDAASEYQAKKRIDAACSAVYDEVRCGLYHRMSTKRRVLITHSLRDPVRFDFDPTDKVELIEIAPREFFNAVANHFTAFIGSLRNPSETLLRTKFEQYFDGRTSGVKRPTVLTAAPARSTY